VQGSRPRIGAAGIGSAGADAIDHIGLVAADEKTLREIAIVLRPADLPIIADEPLDESLGSGFAFEGPDRFVFEIYREAPTTRSTTNA
jgi:hypothetical protein